jgi:hypothetical protein
MSLCFAGYLCFFDHWCLPDWRGLSIFGFAAVLVRYKVSLVPYSRIYGGGLALSSIYSLGWRSVSYIIVVGVFWL